MSDDRAREALILAAMDTLGSPRSPAMPLREVARAAGVTTGAIQHHFGNRQGLLVAAVDRQGERLTERLQAVGRAHPERGRPRLRALLHELLPLDEERTRETRLIAAFEWSAAADPTIATDFQQRYQRLLRLLSTELPGSETDAALLLAVVYGTGADLLSGVATVEQALRTVDRALEVLGA